MATAQQSGADTQTPSVLREVLARIVRRLRHVRLLRLVSRGAFAAACLSLMAVGLARAGLLPLRLPLEYLIPFLLLLGFGLGTLSAARRPMDLMTAARLAEDRLGLKERLSSALDFERTEPVPSDPEAALLRRLQGQDAEAHAQALHPDQVAPLRLPWETKALLATLLVLLLALILPALPIFVSPSMRAERAVVQRSGEELARSARRIEKDADARGLPATKHSAQDMQKLGEQMSQGRMDKKQAMVQMARVSKRMTDEQSHIAQQSDAAAQGGRSLAQAGRQLAQSLAHPVPGRGTDPSAVTSGSRAAVRATSAHDQAASPTPEIRRAAHALQQGSAPGLSEALRDLAQKAASGPMPPDERRRAAQDLQKLSDALKGTPLSGAGEHAQSAADALKRGDSQRAAGEMRQAAQAAQAADRQASPQQDAQGVQDAQKSLQSSQQQMAQAGTPGSPQNGPSGNPGPGGSGESAPAKPGSGRDAHDAAAGGRASEPGASVVRGAPHPLDPRFDPARNPKYGRIFLGAGDGGSGGGGRRSQSRAGDTSSGEHQASSVPYYSSLAPARKTAETAMDREDIPPAYRSSVRRYFDSLQPPAGTSK